MASVRICAAVSLMVCSLVLPSGAWALSAQELSQKSLRKARIGGWSVGDECSSDPAFPAACNGNNMVCTGAAAASSWSGTCACLPGFVVDANDHCVISASIPLNQTVCNMDEDCSSFNNTVCRPSVMANIKRCQCANEWEADANSTGCLKMDCRTKRGDFCGGRNPQYICSAASGFCVCPPRTRSNAAATGCDDLSKTDCVTVKDLCPMATTPSGAVADSVKCDPSLRRCTCLLQAVSTPPLIPENSPGLVYWTPNTTFSNDTTTKCQVSGLNSGCYNNSHCVSASPHKHVCLKSNASNPEVRGVCACPPLHRQRKDGLTCVPAYNLCCLSNRDCGTPAMAAGSNGSASGASLICQAGRCTCPGGSRYQSTPAACALSTSSLVCDPFGLD